MIKEVIIMKKFVITLISIILVAMIAFSMCSFVYAEGNFDISAHESDEENAFSKVGVTITAVSYTHLTLPTMAVV